MPHSDTRSAVEPAPGGLENHPLSSLETRLSIDEATKAVRIEDLGRAGVRNLRVLSESRLTDIIQDLVETRLRDEPLPTAVMAAATARSVDEIRAQYEARWQEFRAQFDSKLKAIERAIEILRRRRALQP